MAEPFGHRTLKPHCAAIGRAARLLAVITLGLLVCNGCHLTASSRIETARGAFYAGDFSTAKVELAKVAKSRSPLAKTAKMDLAVVELASGDAGSALQTLRETRDEFDEQIKLTMVGNVASMVTDDRSRQYEPAGYEQVLIRSLLSICSLATGDGDAESYASQAQLKQTELARAAEERGLSLVEETYQPIALAPYVRGVLREASHHDYDDAVRSYELVSHIQPSFAPAGMDIERCGGGVHSQPGNGVLYLFACVGRGPVLESVEAPTTTAALQIATQVYSLADDQRMMLPNLASVEVPQVAIPFSPAAAVSLDSSGVWLGASQQIVDIGGMAIRQNQAEMPHAVARAIVRRVTKEVTVSQATKAVGVDGIGGELLRFAAVNAWSASEQADTRCWSLLSREIQVLRAELPAGKHRIGVTVVDVHGRPVGPRTMIETHLQDGRNTYLTVFAPDNRVIVADQGDGSRR